MSPHPDPIAPGTDPTLTRVAGALQAQPARRPAPAPAPTRAAAPVDRFTSAPNDSAQRAHDALIAAIRTYAERHYARRATERVTEAGVAQPPIAGSVSAATVAMSPESVKLAVALQSVPIASRNLAPLDSPWAKAPELPGHKADASPGEGSGAGPAGPAAGS